MSLQGESKEIVGLPSLASVILNKKKALKRIFEKKFVGFQFSTPDQNQSLIGLLYQSRVPQNEATKQPFDFEDSNANSSLADMSADLASNFSIGSDDSDADDKVVEAHSMNPRQQLALTVKNWSRTAENDENILQEGAVHALIALTSTEDSLIKKWCAQALYNLSTRPNNRKALLSLGAAGGIIAIANNTRNWKAAKLCVLTLCNLSIEEGSEETLLGEHAQLSLVSFLSARGHFLLPLCAKALYNLTQVSRYSNSLERVIKALLNLPSLIGFFDPTIVLLKAIVNCTRFPELHVRILEDSSLPAFFTGLHAVQPKTPEIANHVCRFVRSLSENEKRRMDLILRGPAKLLAEYNEHCDAEGRRQLIKAMSNIVDCALVFPPKAVVNSLTMLADIATHAMTLSAHDEVVMEHGVYCLHSLAKVQFIGSSTKFWPWVTTEASERVVDIVGICLFSTKPLTQYYAILTAADIFVNDSCIFIFDKIEELLSTFIKSVSRMCDETTTEVMAKTLSSLTQSKMFMDILLRQDGVFVVLEAMIALLEKYPDILSIQEASCRAVVSICGHEIVGFDETRRSRVSQVFYQMLQADQPTLLNSILNGVVVLANKGVTEILNHETLVRVIEIVQNFIHFDEITQIVLAIFRLYSFKAEFRLELSQPSVLDFLFSMAKGEDKLSEELAAIILCNLTAHSDSCASIIHRGLIQLLPSMCGTHPNIQDIHVRTMCNLSSFEESRPQMLKDNILQTILMISLVNSVSKNTKQYCLRVLLNMLDANSITYFVRENIVRAFSGLASVKDAIVQAQCAKGFLVLTSTREGRMEIAMRKTVLMSLFGLLQSYDVVTRNMVGITIYNLLRCDDCYESVAASGGIGLIKVIVTVDSDILREATAQIVISLCSRPSCHHLLAQEPIVPMMVEILHHAHYFAFKAAINALANLSHYSAFRENLIVNDCAIVLLTSLCSTRNISIDLAEEAIRCIYLLSFEKDHAASIINKGKVMLSMHIINARNICSPNTATMMTFILRNLSFNKDARETLVEEDAMVLLISLLGSNQHSKGVIFGALSQLVYNLSKEETLHERLMDGKVMDVVRMIVPSHWEMHEEEEQLAFSAEAILRICATVNLLSETTTCHQPILQGKVIDILSGLLSILPESDQSAAIENEIANCICHITSTPECRQLLSEHGATKLLLQLSTRNAIPDTEKVCSIALSRLSEADTVGTGVVASLLMLSLKMDQREHGSITTDSSMTMQSSASSNQRQQRRFSKFGSTPLKGEKRGDVFQESIRVGLQSSGGAKGFLEKLNSPARKDDTVGNWGSNILTKDAKSQEEAEKAGYVGNYDKFVYEILLDETWVEAGGCSEVEVRISIREPVQSSNPRAYEAADRKDELVVIPMDYLPLPKESKNAELPRIRQGSFVEPSLESSGSNLQDQVYDISTR